MNDKATLQRSNPVDRPSQSAAARSVRHFAAGDARQTRHQCVHAELFDSGFLEEQPSAVVAHHQMHFSTGKQKLFEVRRMHNDVTFLDEFFTEDFCREQKFFTYKENRRTGRLEIEGREFSKIKQQMLQQLSNFGQPFIYVVDANYLNRSELLLGHRHEGVDLKMDYARDTLRNVERIWRRPVSILTVVDDKPKRIRFDGSEISMSDEPAAFRV